MTKEEINDLIKEEKARRLSLISKTTDLDYEFLIHINNIYMAGFTAACRMIENQNT